jgi:hypothetical protein
MAISPESKMKSADRVLVLSVIEGKKPLNTLGASDPRLFNGENKLHAIMDPQTTLWSFKYDMGMVPEPLKCKFTSFKAAKKYADNYFNPRNIEINQVID